MKKVERLRFVESTFGPEFVSPYRACSTLPEIEAAIAGFEASGRTWGLRTDFADGTTQGYQLPFLHHGTPAAARRLWEQRGAGLVYIVCENILRRRLSGVGVKVGPDRVLFEWNDREPTISQRQMYDRPENVRRVVVGPGGCELVWGYAPMWCVPPERASWWGFDRVYDAMVHQGVDEATFTVREDGRIVVW